MRILMALMLLLVTACASPMVPTATGMKSPLPFDSGFDRSKPLTVIVWGDSHGATNMVSSILLQSGARLVERAKIQQVLDEQRVRLSHSADTDADVMKAGHLVGADMIVFVEASMTPAPNVRAAYISGYGAGLASETYYHASVSVRSVMVESGQIAWTGNATYPKPINNPDQGVGYLASAAIRRATCDFAWSNEKGCLQH